MAALDEEARYDRVELRGDDGRTRTLSKKEFEALPLGERVRAILANHVRFFRGAVDVPMKEALVRRT